MPAWTKLATASPLSRRVSSERGQSLVEFAIILPVLILIILGILYFGRYEDYANQETQLAEEGVRWAAVNNNPSTSGQTLQAYIQSQAQPELASGSSDVSAAQVYLYYPSGTTPGVGSPVTACVVTTVKYPFFGLSSATQTIAQSATMRLEVAASNWSTSNNPTATVPSACPPSS